MPISGLEVKTPFDETLLKVFRGRKKKVTRVEKSYFVQLMNQSELALMNFDGLKVELNGINIKVRKKFTKKTYFDTFFTN
tara:strand:+ start:50 stop:289 length:240 start_codon:yes stop_codon:yes gene_type:complete